MTATVLIPVSTGVNVRDILRCGLLDALDDLHVVLVSPLANDASFRRDFSRPGVSIEPMPSVRPGLVEAALGRARHLAARGGPPLTALWRRAARIWRADAPFADLFRRYRPSVAAFPTPRVENAGDLGLALAAQACAIPTVCILSSWDNLSKGRLPIHADWIGVWNQINADEAIRQQGYHPARVKLVGALPFDPYFQDFQDPIRAELCGQLGLDPARGLILLATTGPFFVDQTFILDDLLSALDAGLLARPCQIVVRVHFADRTEFFLPYLSRTEVTLDRPGIWYKRLGFRGWTMTLDDIHHMAGLLTHADIVISMGSTVTVEAAIFDTPSIIVAYSPTEPEAIADILDRKAFRRHYRPLVARSLVTIVRNPAELVARVNRALSCPSDGANERAEMVKTIVPLPDGRASERTADLIRQAARG